MTEREALKLALEALKQIDEAMLFPVAKLAIKKAEEVLAQPEFTKHEVVSAEDWSEWVCPDPKSYLMKCCDCGLVHEAQFKVVRYKSEDEREECDPVNDPNLQAVFRMRRSEEWTPEDTAYRPGGLAQPEQERTGSCPLDDCDGGPKTHGCWAHHCEWKAQPEQEPVAYTGNGTAGREADVRPTGFFFQADKRQPEQKPVGEVYGWHGVGVGQPLCRFNVTESDMPVGSLLYTTPPQRKPLTDEQIEKIADEYGAGGWICDFARAIEAAHGIKGEA